MKAGPTKPKPKSKPKAKAPVTGRTWPDVFMTLPWLMVVLLVLVGGLGAFAYHNAAPGKPVKLFGLELIEKPGPPPSVAVATPPSANVIALPGGSTASQKRCHGSQRQPMRRVFKASTVGPKHGETKFSVARKQGIVSIPLIYLARDGSDGIRIRRQQEF